MFSYFTLEIASDLFQTELFTLLVWHQICYYDILYSRNECIINVLLMIDFKTLPPKVTKYVVIWVLNPV